jgi:hypothetical protein
MSMTHTRCTHPGILEVIPGSRIIQFCGNAELVAPTLRQYGELITAFSGDGPHALRVHPALDFATIVLTVETQLTPLLLSERVVGT